MVPKCWPNIKCWSISFKNSSNFLNQSEKEHANNDIEAGWPVNDDSSASDDQCELRSPNSVHRPDSGVGESVRCITKNVYLFSD